MKTPALKNERLVVLGMTFRARKVFGSFEKRTPGPCFSKVPKTFRAQEGSCQTAIRLFKEEGCRSGESTMWYGFDFLTRCHTWIELVGCLLCF